MEGKFYDNVPNKAKKQSAEISFVIMRTDENHPHKGFNFVQKLIFQTLVKSSTNNLLLAASSPLKKGSNDSDSHNQDEQQVSQGESN